MKILIVAAMLIAFAHSQAFDTYQQCIAANQQAADARQGDCFYNDDGNLATKDWTFKSGRRSLQIQKCHEAFLRDEIYSDETGRCECHPINDHQVTCSWYEACDPSVRNDCVELTAYNDPPYRR